MNRLLTWIDERTGLAANRQKRRDRAVPASGRCANAWGAAILFTFFFQAVTGIALWMYYSPSAQSAWESVYFLQYEVAGGWLLRAAHHVAGNVLVATTGLYVLWLIFSGRYRTPREFVFWVALAMGLFTLALALTGDLLAWDENSYYGTKTRVSYLLLLPVIGDDLHKLALGGADVGHYTLTRFFALHAGLFSAIFAGLAWLHVKLLHRADAVAAREGEKSVPQWPNQTVLNVLACLCVLAAIGGVVALNVTPPAAPSADGGPVAEVGLHLGAPADLAEPFDAARPEWAFVGIYELVKRFPGSLQFVPVFVVPGALLAYFLLMPLIGRLKIGHIVNMVVTVLVVGGTVWLSYESIQHDLASDSHQHALAIAREKAERVKVLAQSPTGIPSAGAVSLLRNDAKLQGPKLFTTHCASCHSCLSPDGQGIKSETPSAPNLFGFPNRQWVAGMLDAERIRSADYFGNTAFKNGDMVGFVKDTLVDLSEEEQEEVESLVMALSAEADLKSQRAADEADAERIEEGKEFITDIYGCADCHKFHDAGQLGGAPDLTGYGSREWLIGIISDPAHARFYGENNDRMPAYYEDPEAPAENILKESEVALLADWLRGEWYEPSAPVAEAATVETATEEPAADAEPADAEPADAEPAAEEPAAAEEPTMDDPVDEPAADEPATDENAVDEPAAEEPADVEPAMDEPASPEPSAEEPAAEEPATGPPAAEEPAIEQPTDTESSPAMEEPAPTEEPAGTETTPADEAPSGEPAPAEPESAETPGEPRPSVSEPADVP